MSMRTASWWLTLSLSAVLLAGCDDNEGAVGVTGDLVGGACALHQDCIEGGTCLVGDHFPEGTCTVPCAAPEASCPEGAECVKREKGVCLLACEVPTDCRPGYTCKGEDRLVGGGQALVCIHN